MYDEEVSHVLHGAEAAYALTHTFDGHVDPAPAAAAADAEAPLGSLGRPFDPDYVPGPGEPHYCVDFGLLEKLDHSDRLAFSPTKEFAPGNRSVISRVYAESHECGGRAAVARLLRSDRR